MGLRKSGHRIPLRPLKGTAGLSRAGSGELGGQGWPGGASWSCWPLSELGVPMEVIQHEGFVLSMVCSIRGGAQSMVELSPWWSLVCGGAQSVMELNPWWNSIHGGAESMVDLNPWWSHGSAQSMVELSLGGALSVVELSPWWSSIHGGAQSMVGSCCGQTGPRCSWDCDFWVSGVVVPLLSPARVLCARVEDGDRSREPKPCGWSVEYAPEMLRPCLGAGGCCGRRPWSIFILVAPRGRHMPGLGIPRHPMQTAGDSPAHPGSPGPPPKPTTPPCSSSSLFKAVVEEGENPVLQLLPSAAGMWAGEGAEPPAQQLKITKYFPNIIRFPCRQLP
ncbi:uncharacterized protein LOC119708963 [Motacilla alba alba]|uniref:uncharacterized protein LOC119708963 n=1 Tax=Motacilla alba alba TaxID=1094192 RepID=UPI0018D4E5E5|nr:uncharacterized protein LOC119708963 [Motacilla alba alba]